MPYLTLGEPLDAYLYPYITPTEGVYDLPRYNRFGKARSRILPVGAYSQWSDVAERGAASAVRYPTTAKEVGGVGANVRCRYDQDCPAGTVCMDGKCVREWCTTDGGSSSGVCDNTPDFAPPYEARTSQCTFDADCGSGNCLNGPGYLPDPRTGKWLCGRPPVDSIYARYSRVNPMYGAIYGWRTLSDGPLYLQDRPS